MNKKILIFMTVFLVVALALTVVACSKESKPTISFELNADGESYSVKYINRTVTCIEIPSTYNDKPVTRIAFSAFKGHRELESITIPDSVTSIGSDAFYNCSGLTSITIEKWVTLISSKAFDGCSELSRIDFSGTVYEWKTIKRETDWDKKTGDYTVYCTDGKIKKTAQ